MARKADRMDDYARIALASIRLFNGIAALFVPGVGWVLGGGALASAIVGAAAATAAGAAAGGVYGYLKDQGLLYWAIGIQRQMPPVSWSPALPATYRKPKPLHCWVTREPMHMV